MVSTKLPAVRTIFSISRKQCRAAWPISISVDAQPMIAPPKAFSPHEHCHCSLWECRQHGPRTISYPYDYLGGAVRAFFHDTSRDSRRVCWTPQTGCVAYGWIVDFSIGCPISMILHPAVRSYHVIDMFKLSKVMVLRSPSPPFSTHLYRRGSIISSPIFLLTLYTQSS